MHMNWLVPNRFYIDSCLLWFVTVKDSISYEEFIFSGGIKLIFYRTPSSFIEF